MHVCGSVPRHHFPVTHSWGSVTISRCQIKPEPTSLKAMWSGEAPTGIRESPQLRLSLASSFQIQSSKKLWKWWRYRKHCVTQKSQAFKLKLTGAAQAVWLVFFTITIPTIEAWKQYKGLLNKRCFDNHVQNFFCFTFWKSHQGNVLTKSPQISSRYSLWKA